MYCTCMRGTSLRRNYCYDKPTSAYHLQVTFSNIATFKREYVWEKVSHDTVFLSPWSLSCLNRGFYRDRFKRLSPYLSIFRFSPHALICRAEHPIITLTWSRSALAHRRPVNSGPQGETTLLATTSSHLCVLGQEAPEDENHRGGHYEAENKPELPPAPNVTHCIHTAYNAVCLLLHVK